MFSGTISESRVSSALYQLKHFKYSSHYWILNFISRAQRPLRILDVGTADGYLGAILKAQGHFVVGVEQDAILADKARQYYDLFHVADIENFSFPYVNDFDFILFADVLEHLRDPAVVLRRCLASLNETGEIIVSIPNSANFYMRACLLFGHFEYTERGIFDRTHLRFFTLASFRKLLSQSGLKVFELAPTPIPVQFVVPMLDGALFFPLHEFHYILVRLWKTLFAYQFVVRARRRSA
jgi:2-polyprenyl-3-methyl-5-hydroxy-6-metoxy-1,4-benzoquinol methylase